MNDADPLPPPTTAEAADGVRDEAERPRRLPRAGQLTTAWQIMVATAWAAAFFALAGVWKASEEVGIATWWLGPRADPQPVLVRILPFIVIVAIALCAVYNVRFVSWLSLAGAAGMAVMAAIDLSYLTGLAIAEFAIAGALGLVSLASFGGRYRRPNDPPSGAAPEGVKLADPVSAPPAMSTTAPAPPADQRSAG